MKATLCPVENATAKTSGHEKLPVRDWSWCVLVVGRALSNSNIDGRKKEPQPIAAQNFLYIMMDD